MACIRKRRGKWVLDYRDQHGERHWETVEGSRKDAESVLADRIKEIGKGEYQSVKDQKTFNELIEAYREMHINVNLRGSTREDYNGRINLHILPYFSNIKIQRITPEMVEKFKAHLLEHFEKQAKRKDVQGEVGRRTVNKCLTLLWSICKYGIKMRWMSYNPVDGVARLKTGTSHKDEALVQDNILRPNEIQRLLSVFTPSDERWRMITMTALLTGLRQGELLGLKWTDIDWYNRQVYVQRSFTSGHFYQPKTKYSRRKVDIPGALISELKRWKLACPKGELDLVFPNLTGNPEMAPNLLYRGFYPALRRAGLRQIRFHDLRHTYASLLIANGEHPKYIQSQLGHSSIRVTLDIYGHLMKETNGHAAEKLADLALGNSGKPTQFSRSGSKMVADYAEGGTLNAVRMS